MSRYPIIFGLRDLIQGDGFLAGIAVDGRALLHDEGDYIWVEGVNPGGFAGTGSNQGEAIEDFRRAYLAVVYDIASEEKSFEGLKAAIERFFHNSGDQPVRDWEAAVKDVREGKVDAPWMTRRSADTPLQIRVVEIAKPAARNNRLEKGPALAA